MNKTYFLSKHFPLDRLFSKYRPKLIGLFFVFFVLLAVGCATRGTVESDREGVIKDVAVEYLNGEEKVVIKSTSPMKYTAFKLKQPLRLVLDINDMDVSKIEENIKVDKPIINSIKVSRFEGSNTARLELVLNQEAPHEILRPSPETIIVSFKGSGEIPLEALAKAISIQDISLMKVPNNKLRVLLKTSGKKPEFSFFKTANSNQLILDVKNSVLLPTVIREVEISDSSAVNKIRSYQNKKVPVPEARIIIDLNNKASYNVYRDAGNILVDVSPSSGYYQEPKAVIAAENKLDSDKKIISKKTEVEQKSIVKEKQFVGKKIYMDLQKTDITSVLRLISDVSGMNIVVSGAVSGTITMNLVDVPWDQALDIILKTAKLGMVKEGNVIRVAPFEVIAAEKEGQIAQETAAKKLEELVSELFTVVIPVNYAQVADLSKALDKLKGPRGYVLMDDRTNSIIVTDSAKNVAKMEDLIKKLDKRTPQILIEARIVEVNRNYTQSLGIEWGGALKTSSHPSVTIDGSAVGTKVVSLPAAVGAGAGGALSATLGSATGTDVLDIRLSALEKSGKARILSTPKIITSDNNEATIHSGKSIPYSTVSADGTTVQFVDATISLTVKPHVTSDGFIAMTIEATKNEADFGNQVQGTPSIIKKSAKTSLLIKNGDTTVIGGLYKTTESIANAGVPFFNKIPILGWLFRNQTDIDNGEELLIFITATQIN